MHPKPRAPRNRTITISHAEREQLSSRILDSAKLTPGMDFKNQILCHDMLIAGPMLSEASVDLLILDPPYNLTKKFNAIAYKKQQRLDYQEHLDTWIKAILPALKKTVTVYICTEWGTSPDVFEVAEQYFTIRNRITWEREKGRGASANWKNCSEDIWFCTLSDDYTFNVDDVKMKRKVIAPYKDKDGVPKDWEASKDGNYRLTHPSNLWTDITVPFWSMPENTDHPTQKPEKLIAKLILASSDAGDVVLDPFLGSGTTAAVARKLGRHFVGIEQDFEYCLLAAKRLQLAESDSRIQGYDDGVFWERNSTALASVPEKKKISTPPRQDLFFTEQ